MGDMIDCMLRTTDLLYNEAQLEKRGRRNDRLRYEDMLDGQAKHLGKVSEAYLMLRDLWEQTCGSEDMAVYHRWAKLDDELFPKEAV